MDKVSYSFVKQEDSIVFRSKVQAFNLDHVTDKDIRSFYLQFSQYAAFDTGLLPLDGTGLLCVRKAGEYTQVAYQYKPGSYYVNWGTYEKDPEAKKYLLAQPYRVVIIDFKSNNLLGARTFYTITPVTHPDVQLYHVNLPNINCRGYRGNGVGWICLYHNTDWSSLTFNERLALALERCSGSEAYNDNNMSETDGPRFYRDMYQNDASFSYMWNPSVWQNKTSQDGYEWTLFAPWIPVVVEGLDRQAAHSTSSEAVPLTFSMALTGTYKSYYTDKMPLKPINALQRNGESVITDITNYFVQSYNNSSTQYVGRDIMEDSKKFRDSRKEVNQGQLFEESESEEDEDHDDDDHDQGGEEGPF